jgi:hypothetical protein
MYPYLSRLKIFTRLYFFPQSESNLQLQTWVDLVSRFEKTLQSGVAITLNTGPGMMPGITRPLAREDPRVGRICASKIWRATTHLHLTDVRPVELSEEATSSFSKMDTISVEGSETLNALHGDVSKYNLSGLAPLVLHTISKKSSESDHIFVYLQNVQAARILPLGAPWASESLSSSSDHQIGLYAENPAAALK